MANDLDMFAAHTQSRITYALIGGFLGLMFALLCVACLPLKVDDKLLAILDRIVTAMLPIVGGAVGFWTARHRAQNGADDGDDIVQPTLPPSAPIPPLVPSTTQEKKS